MIQKIKVIFVIGRWKKLCLKVSQGGPRGVRMHFFCNLDKNLTRVLSIVISMFSLTFTDFEAIFAMSLKDKVCKNAPKHEIV